MNIFETLDNAKKQIGKMQQNMPDMDFLNNSICKVEVDSIPEEETMIAQQKETNRYLASIDVNSFVTRSELEKLVSDLDKERKQNKWLSIIGFISGIVGTCIAIFDFIFK